MNWSDNLVNEIVPDHLKDLRRNIILTLLSLFTICALSIEKYI